jgi:hypothetical protein
MSQVLISAWFCHENVSALEIMKFDPFRDKENYIN